MSGITPSVKSDGVPVVGATSSNCYNLVFVDTNTPDFQLLNASFDPSTQEYVGSDGTQEVRFAASLVDDEESGPCDCLCGGGGSSQYNDDASPVYATVDDLLAVSTARGGPAGGTVEVPFVQGSTYQLSDGVHVGDRVNLAFGSSPGQYDEMIVTGNFSGLLRNSQHAITETTNTMIVRPPDAIQFVWDGGEWVAISSELELFVGPCWDEKSSGRADLCGTTLVPANGIATAVLPDDITNTNYRTFLQWAVSQVSWAGVHQTSVFPIIPSRTTASFDIGNTSTRTNGNIAVYWTVPDVRMDYAALGAVGSF